MELELELNCAESGNRMIEPLQLMVDDRCRGLGAYYDDGFIFRLREFGLLFV